MVTKTQSNKAENKSNISKTAVGNGAPRGGDESLSTPEPSGVEPNLPSQKRPYNPSDRIYDQIKETDARTKLGDDEYDKFTDEQLKDAAVKMGIDGNDNLPRAELLHKIKLWKDSGKRMIPEEPGDYEAQKREAKEDHDKNNIK